MVRKSFPAYGIDEAHIKGGVLDDQGPLSHEASQRRHRLGRRRGAFHHAVGNAVDRGKGRSDPHSRVDQGLEGVYYLAPPENNSRCFDDPVVKGVKSVVSRSSAANSVPQTFVSKITSISISLLQDISIYITRPNLF